MQLTRMIVMVAIGAGFTSSSRSDAGLSTQSATTHMMVDPSGLEWRPLPKEWTEGAPPPGFDPVGRTEVAIVSGDPTREGALYVIRLRSTPGTRLPVHWHPNDEHITVLSGTWCVGMGDRFDEGACRDMPAGSYVFVPNGSRHFAVARGTVVQIHGIGPFKAVFVK
jgi:quercetin dioxygenase-like cupin family protein